MNPNLTGLGFDTPLNPELEESVILWVKSTGWTASGTSVRFMGISSPVARMSKILILKFIPSCFVDNAFLSASATVFAWTFAKGDGRVPIRIDRDEVDNEFVGEI